jgi:hypothetical protein
LRRRHDDSRYAGSRRRGRDLAAIRLGADVEELYFRGFLLVSVLP